MTEIRTEAGPIVGEIQIKGIDWETWRTLEASDFSIGVTVVWTKEQPFDAGRGVKLLGTNYFEWNLLTSAWEKGRSYEYISRVGDPKDPTINQISAMRRESAMLVKVLRPMPRYDDLLAGLTDSFEKQEGYIEREYMDSLSRANQHREEAQAWLDSIK